MPDIMNSPAVVRKENYGRIFVQTQLVEIIQQTTESLINTLQHRSIKRISVLVIWIDFLLVLFNDLFLCLEWTMDSIMPKKQSERFFRVPII